MKQNKSLVYIQKNHPVLQLILFSILAVFTISVITLSGWINDIVVGMIVAGALLGSKVNFFKIEETVKNYYLISIVLFCYLLASVLYHHPFAFFENKFEPFRYLLIWYLVYIFLLRKFDSVEILFKVVVFTGLVLLCMDVQILIEGTQRGQGFLSTPIQRGNLGMLIGLMSLVIFFYFKGKWQFFALFSFFGGIGLSILSGSRGGWLALLISVVTILLVLWRYDRRSFKILIILLLCLLVIIFIWGDYTPIPYRLERTWESLFLYISGENLRTSLGHRFEMWKVSFDAFLQKPIFGWGFDSFKSVYDQYFHAREAVRPAKVTGWNQPHNDYLLFLVETGVVGFIALMLFLLYPLKVYIKSLLIGLQKKEKQLVFVSLLGIVMLESLMEFMLSDRNLIFRHTFYFFVTVNVMCLMFIDRLMESQQGEGNN